MIAWSQVATYTASSVLLMAVRRYTCSIIGRPSIEQRGLPGKRVDPIRAGMIATILLPVDAIGSLFDQDGSGRGAVATRQLDG